MSDFFVRARRPILVICGGLMTLALAASLCGASARAAPRSIDDCEAIKDANAYNLCLASFGPMRGQRAKSYPGVAAEPGRPTSAPAAARAKRGRQGSQRQLWRSHSGRVRMVITPGR